jgi:hypothetical protein
MKKSISVLIVFSIQLLAGIGVGYSGVGPLPVELTSFTANRSGSNIELRWITATEVNNNGFEIERANLEPQNGNSIWEKIGFVNGNGNSTTLRYYNFVDIKPFSEKAQYRLKQIDNNGTFKYSKSIEVGSGFLNYDLAQNYPNPFNPSTVITYSIPTASNVKVEVVSVLGKLVKTLVNENQAAGSYQVNFDASGLSSGIYYYKIQSGNFAATRKMLLLK